MSLQVCPIIQVTTVDFLCLRFLVLHSEDPAVDVSSSHVQANIKVLKRKNYISDVSKKQLG